MGKIKKEEPMKVCFKCNHGIDDKKENYYSFTEWLGEKKIKTDYAHKLCWDNFLKHLANTDEAMSIMRGLKGRLQEMGVLPMEEIQIK